MNECFLCRCRALLRLDFLKSEVELIQNNHGHDHLALSNVFYRQRVDVNVENLSSSNPENNNNPIIEHRRMKRHRFLKLNDLKLAFSELYLMLILLKNYQTLNFVGFRKILKKHDKLFETNRGYQWR